MTTTFADILGATHHPLPAAERLVDLAKWLTGQEKKRRLGLPSEWNQNTWVDARPTTGKLRELVEVEGVNPAALPLGWSCGTAACAAGHIALQDGGMPAFHFDGGFRPMPPSTDETSFPWEFLSDAVMYFDGRREAIDDYAARVLAIDDTEVGRSLFEAGNDWSTMIELISDILGVRENVLVTAVGGDELPEDPDYDEDEEDDDSGW